MSDWLPDPDLLGWRALVLGLVVLFAAYAVVAFVRMLRLGRPRSPRPAPSAAPTTGSFEAVRRDALQPYLREMEAAETDAAQPRARPASADADAPAWEAPPTAFAERQLRDGLEREVATLREELDALRGAVASLREELRQDMVGIKAQQSVSPFYRDAMQMALAGASADTIAERCGIARGEAELVVALVHGGDGLNDNLGLEGDDDGGRPRA